MTNIHEKAGTILLIDDDQAFRDETKRTLEERGYDVVAMDTGNHAVRYAQNKAWSWYPWLIITDIVMDGMGGFQLIRRMSELYPNRSIPVIVVSRLYTAEDITEAELAGASAYLKKPFTPEKLAETIKKVTEKEHRTGSLIFE